VIKRTINTFESWTTLHVFHGRVYLSVCLSVCLSDDNFRKPTGSSYCTSCISPHRIRVCVWSARQSC